MKTTFPSIWVSLMVLTAAGTVALAQDDNTTYEAPDATSVVYQAPVTYYASVVYQAPVVYYAPVYYVSAAAAAASCAAQTPCYQQCEPASTVTVIGAHGGTYTTTYSGRSCAASTIVQFGQRGGWFGGRW